MDPLDHAPSYSLLCPQGRFQKDEESYHIIKSSYLISDAADGKSNHRHLVFLRNRKEDGLRYILCQACYNLIENQTYYICSYCNWQTYHKECVESPSKFHSSDHPKHPLQLVWFPGNRRQHQKQCCSCRRYRGRLLYYCSICDFSLDSICVGKPTSLIIDNPKRHKHTLHYFPRISALVCDVCGLEGHIDYLYVCLLCDFIVHKRCVYFPFVIKVSRHDHRLGFTYKLPYEKSTDCGVCHRKIKENFGEYSCTKEGCIYAVHSRCAMRRNVCDGKELEGEPEEVYEDTKMFEEKGDGIIQHSTHPSHPLKLESKFHDDSKHCQACRLPSYDDHGGNVYRCMQCDDFILHESCAYIPRVKQFMLHVHPLILDPSYTTNLFRCWKCDRYSCGFKYVCSRQECDVEFDIICASICEPFDHHSHPHPLFISSGEYEGKTCSICQSRSWREPLYCVKCDFVLCFNCATLPRKARYDLDEHLLIFSYEEYANDNELIGCQLCEEDINPRKGLYACNKCGLTLHIECLLGRDPYMKLGSYSKWGKKVYILPNTCSTRPICKTCQRRCPYKIKMKSSRDPYTYCSFHCYNEWFLLSVNAKL